MSYFTQDEITETWDRLKTGDDLDGSKIRTEKELEQSLTIPTVATFSSVNDDLTSIVYTRKRESKETQWGEWETAD